LHVEMDAIALLSWGKALLLPFFTTTGVLAGTAAAADVPAAAAVDEDVAAAAAVDAPVVAAAAVAAAAAVVVAVVTAAAVAPAAAVWLRLLHWLLLYTEKIQPVIPERPSN
jgi:hypothetical protein